MNQEEFLLQHLTEGKSYQEICDEYGLDRATLQEWWATGIELRNQIKKSNILFANKKGKEEFSEFQQAGQRSFFTWYRTQPRECAYCGTEEFKLEQLFTAGVLSSKRGRGKTLELERVDAKSNHYSPTNCVLACYFCNNHKSDIISEIDHREYFAKQVKQYLEDKYAQMVGNGNR